MKWAQTPLIGLLLASTMILSGCSFVSFPREYYKQETGKPVSKRVLSFASKEAMAAGATLQNLTAAEVYYKGTEPESKEAKILYDMSYRFIDLAGVNRNFDPADPDAIEDIFERADRALEEKDRVIHQLEVDVQRKLEEVNGQRKIVKDREAALVANNGKWTARFDNLWRWLWGILIGAIVILVGLGIAQVMTGIPFLTIFFGGIRLIFGAAKQTIKGVQALRDELKDTAANGGTEEEKKTAKEMLAKIDHHLQTNQDESVKEWIAGQKAKLKVRS